MIDLLSFGVISCVALVLGLIKYGSLSGAYKNTSWQLKFVEIWNDFVNFFITGLIAYYFIRVKWPLLLEGKPLEISDLVLLIILMLGLFGHLCVASKNITDGIESVLKKILG